MHAAVLWPQCLLSEMPTPTAACPPRLLQQHAHADPTSPTPPRHCRSAPPHPRTSLLQQELLLVLLLMLLDGPFGEHPLIVLRRDVGSAHAEHRGVWACQEVHDHSAAVPLYSSIIMPHLPFLSWGGTRALLKAGFGPVDVLGVLAAFWGAELCVKLPPVTWLWPRFVPCGDALQVLIRQEEI